MPMSFYKNLSSVVFAGGLLVGATISMTPMALAGDAAFSFPARDSGLTSTVVFSGIDFANESTATYSGLIKAFNGDLSKDGFLFRAVGVFAAYEYDTIINNDRTRIDGDAWLADVMLGYQFLHPGLRTAVYIGAQYQEQDLTPSDPSNKVRGDEVGFKVVGELETDNTSPFYVGLIGAYSTDFDTYWARARVGLQSRGYTYGVEGVALGNEGYDNQRLGGFVDIPFPIGPLYGEVSVYAGYQFADEGKNDGVDGTGGLGGARGAYGGVGYSFSF